MVQYRETTLDARSDASDAIRNQRFIFNSSKVQNDVDAYKLL